MKIGIDLDNTLVNYEQAFLAAAKILQLEFPPSVRSKIQIRGFLRSKTDGELKWQRLQGLAYGTCVKTHAKLYPGVKRFLWRARQLGHSVIVISHKTEYGHGDLERTPLRVVASEFLAAQGLTNTGDSLIQAVKFRDSFEAKVACIEEHNLDWFIDDLYEVIFELRKKVPKLRTIFFERANNYSERDSEKSAASLVCSDWQQVDAVINGAWTFTEITQLSRRLTKSEPTSIESVSAGGNAGVYRVSFPSGGSAKFKIYPIDPEHDRLLSEYAATSGLLKQGFHGVARPLAMDDDLGIGIYEWIDGQSVAAPNREDILSSLDFLRRLHQSRESVEFPTAIRASASCLSGRDIVNQINCRLLQFDSPQKNYPELGDFFTSDFLPVFVRLDRWAQDNWPIGGDFETRIPKSQQTLSPSDFGFHNAIRRTDGSLAFSDFEYFGWDDPVKLIADFILHPGMKLGNDEKAFWIKGALQIYGIHLASKLQVCLPLYGLIWCLILLNDFRPEVWQRRVMADAAKNAVKEEIRNRQLARAHELLRQIKCNYADHLMESI